MCLCFSFLCLLLAFILLCCMFVFFFKQKTAYEMRISDWSSDVCSSDLQRVRALESFLDDAYGSQHCVRDGILPAQLIASSQYFYRQAEIGRASCRERVCQYV